MISKKSQIDPLGPHTVNTIIGVIALIMLIFAGYMLYKFLSTESTDLKNAEANLKAIKNLMDIAKENPGQKYYHDVMGPGEEWWWIVVFPFEGTVERPAKCYSERKSYCLCICERPSKLKVGWNFISFQGGTLTTILDKCNSNGRCQTIENPVKTEYQGFYTPIPIEKPPIEIEVEYIDNNNGYTITFVK